MAKGFLTGIIWGTVVSAVGAGALSVTSGRVEGVVPLSPPDPMSVTAPDAPDAGDAGTAPAARASADDANPERDEAAAPAMQAPDAAPDGAMAEPPMASPEMALETGVPDAAEPSAAPRIAQAEADPAPESDAPAAPAATADLTDSPVSAEAETAPPSAPVIGAAPDAPDAGEPDAAAQVTALQDTPAPSQEPGAALDAPAPDSDPDLSTDPADRPEPAAPETAQDVAEADAAPEMAEAEAAPEADEADAPREVVEPEDAPGSRLAQRAGSLVDRKPAVQENRLPRIAAAAPQPDSETGEDAEAAPAATPDALADTPLARNAVAVDAAPGVPRMAVILIDDGTGPLGPEALEAFPFPVSFAIAPGHPAPAQTAQAYRDLGFEVLVIGAVPEGAQASDVEVTLAGAVDAVPQAVAVMEAPEGGLQGSREVSTQATEFLAASGHGLVMLPKGLNTAQKLALKEGVPSVSLFRDFDGEGQDAGMIRRTLDQATFRAKQEGSVVMLGRLRADTISALVLWGLQDRTDSVALVPVSTVLRESVMPPE